VTGNPLFRDSYHNFDNVVKKNQIIISNRFDYEKRPNISLDIAQIIKDKHPDWSIIVTTSNEKLKSNQQWLLDKARIMEKAGTISILENLSKEEYHRNLAESKVMLTNSIEENFGYCVVEALYYNTYPLAPRGLSHDELLKDLSFIFRNIDEIIPRIEDLMKMSVTFSTTSDVDKFFDVPRVIVNECKTTRI
jgi:glycosyltransferase involved in cell wall biosynthesis